MPVAAPILIVVAALAKLTVVAVVLTRSKLVLVVVKLVVTLGLVIVGLDASTNPPVPVVLAGLTAPLVTLK